jgi:hypothetical protein
MKLAGDQMPTSAKASAWTSLAFAAFDPDTKASSVEAACLR